MTEKILTDEEGSALYNAVEYFCDHMQGQGVDALRDAARSGLARIERLVDWDGDLDDDDNEGAMT
jgi:hypothetical protein